jgi:Transglutaminase-like superfamily
LSFSEKWQLLHAFILLFCLKVSLLVLPFNIFKNLYNKTLRLGTKKAYTQTQVERKIYFIKVIAANIPLAFTCLPQALALKYYLKKDTDVQLIIGVNTEITFKAHAWVEKNKLFLIGDIPFENYTPLWTWS